MHSRTPTRNREILSWTAFWVTLVAAWIAIIVLAWLSFAPRDADASAARTCPAGAVAAAPCVARDALQGGPKASGAGPTRIRIAAAPL